MFGWKPRFIKMKFTVRLEKMTASILVLGQKRLGF